MNSFYLKNAKKILENMMSKKNSTIKGFKIQKKRHCLKQRKFIIPIKRDPRFRKRFIRRIIINKQGQENVFLDL